MSLGDKITIVTGAARGIGLACAQRFAADGATVVIADIDEENGEAAVKELVEAGHQARFISCDVGERLDVRNLVAETVDAYDRIDVLISNAGVVLAADFLELTEEDFDRVIKTNLKGMFLVGQAVAKQMVAQTEAGGPPGSIINMSSVNAVFGIPNQVPYTVSKGGIAQLTKVMALALAPYGIRVNAIGPGSIMTEMLHAVNEDPEARAKLLSRTPIGRIGEPSEVAAIAAFLASDDSSYVTAQTIYADGGRLALNYTVPMKE
ncbi:MAG: 3-oxoacyl-ACP reductase FabG [Gammaproteobacteria bacterium]|nr:3-oxoacyl-ACP reductase FabG [Gammaproteobacteria bacterium]